MLSFNILSENKIIYKSTQAFFFTTVIGGMEFFFLLVYVTITLVTIRSIYVTLLKVQSNYNSGGLYYKFDPPLL